MSCGLGAIVLVFMLVKHNVENSVLETDLLKKDLQRLEEKRKNLLEKITKNEIGDLKYYSIDDFLKNPLDTISILREFLTSVNIIKKSIINKHFRDLGEHEFLEADYIITNPPWDRKLLHPMIEYFTAFRPTWLLFDADWIHTKQSVQYLPLLKKIVSIGRVQWIPDSKSTGKDNCCWYLFSKGDSQLIQFVGRKP